MIKLLYSKEDTLVLIEVSELVTRIHDVEIIEDLSPDFYDVMAHLIFQNTNGRLKIKVLEYWQKIIDVTLKCEGMVDGKFPEATFSKQLKRIIHFDRPEIRKRVYSALNKLSDNGCLAVFVHVIKKETNVKICETALECFGGLINLLKKYDITSSYSSSSSNSPPFEYTSPVSNLSALLDLDSPADPMTTDFESIEIQDLEPSGDQNTKDLHAVQKIETVIDNVISSNDFLKFVYEELENYISEVKNRTKNDDDFFIFLDEILLKCNIRR